VDDPAYVTGFLVKRGEKGLIRGYKRRWFVLNKAARTFSYYETKLSPQPIKTVALTASMSVECSKHHPSSFELVTPGRTYYLSADTEQEMKQWVAAFCETFITCFTSNMQAWTVKEVGEWIEHLGYPQYKDAFIKNDITGPMLAKLDSTTLKSELSISSFGARSHILESIQKKLQQDRGEGGGAGGVSFGGMFEMSEPNSRASSQAGSDITGDGRAFPSSAMLCHIGIDELDFMETLGSGFFGEVRKASWRCTVVAVKSIFRETYNNRSDLFQQEVGMLNLLRHPNILQFIGVAEDGNKHYIVTEFMGGGSLEAFLFKKFYIFNGNPSLRLRFAKDIAKGMCYLHGWKPDPILHRDLGSRNILLNEDQNLAKVADFGLSRFADNKRAMTTAVGCLPWVCVCTCSQFACAGACLLTCYSFQVAPEVFKGDSYSSKADVYSFGMILFELMTGHSPLPEDMEPLKMANMVAHEGFRPPLPPACPPSWRGVIEKCWAGEPASRPDFSEIIRALEGIDPDDGRDEDVFEDAGEDEGAGGGSGGGGGGGGGGAGGAAGVMYADPADIVAARP